MIRFVDLRSDAALLGGRFAWFNTVSDQFIKVGGEQVWSTWDDFMEAVEAGGGALCIDVKRFRSLVSEWVFKLAEEETKIPDEHWKRIGYITIDSGLCWIGDPCYVLHREPDPAIGETWKDFCDKVKDKSHKMFGNGLGVVTSTGFGDGIYPVEALIEDEKIMAMRVMFDDSSGKVPNMREQWDEERG